MGTIKRTFANNILTSGKLDATDLFGTIPASNIDDTTVSAVTELPSALGDAIESTATDPASPSEGQLWYNSSEGKLKIYGLVAAVWASGGNLNTTRTAGGLAGTQTAAIAAGGFAPGESSATELYNGTSWTSNPTGLGTARYELSALGTQTAALAIGGYAAGPSIVSTVESWNGSSWSPSPSMNTTKADAGTAGIQTAGLTFGGANPTGILSATESWNGTSWTTVNSMNTARSYLAGCGIQTSALAFGGYVPPSSTPTAATESWNGTSWTSVNSLNTARKALGGAGASNTAAVAFGGNTGTVTTTATEVWNGTSWTTNSNGMGNSQQNMRGIGTQSAALSATGRAGPPAFTLSNATEEFTGAFLSNKNVTIS